MSPSVTDEPLFLLALPCSFGARIGASLGRHPQLYDLPETHLFTASTLMEWMEMASKDSFHMSHGLLRAVAQLYFAEQTESTIRRAQAWLARRPDFTTGYVLETLAECVAPRRLIEKSPSLCYSADALQRTRAMFPLARFVHLVEDPLRYSQSVRAALRDATSGGGAADWLRELAEQPEQAWYRLHSNLCTFVDSVPESQRYRVPCEDLLGDPPRVLRELLNWLGLSTHQEAIEEMQHPERSPYAGLGPPNALYGSDYRFLTQPALSVAAAELTAPDTAAREQGITMSAEVKSLAERFGYK